MKRFFSGIFIVMLVLGTTCLYSKVQVGEEVLERFETQHPYAGKKGVVCEKVFHFPNAGYISIHFSAFDLAKNDYVEIASPDGRKRYMYKDKGKKVNHGRETISEFWARHIPGDTAIVRLYSKNKRGGWGFVIDKWARGHERGYIEAVMADIEDAQIMCGPCGNDDREWAKCYEGTTMYDKSKTVYRLLSYGVYPCTGWLLGSQGHLMTTNSCIEDQDDVDNTDFEFMAECECDEDDGCGYPGQLPCPGTIEERGSSTLVKTNSSLDYSLILLPVNRTATLGYRQFRNQLPTIGERIYIPQHPAYCGKKLAVLSDVDGPYAKIYSKGERTGGGPIIRYYADTSSGSLGAPVIAYCDHLVVALHHYDHCPGSGIPSTSIISDLGIDLPADAIGTPSDLGSYLPPDAVGPLGSPCSYCSSSGNSQNYEWIERVKVGDLDNSSGPSRYTDFSYLKANLAKGANVNIELTPGYSGSSYQECWRIWIDYNHDKVFSEDEKVFEKTGSGTVTGSFTVPTSALFGYTRMRVSMSYSGSGCPPACGTILYGEVEDYDVCIMYGIVGNITEFGIISTSPNRRAMPFTMPENGFIESVTMYHEGGTGSDDMILAVYEGASLPAYRLGITATTAVSATKGWQTIDLTSRAYVSGGSTVWLAWVYENNPGIRYQTGPPPGRAEPDEYKTWSGGMPDPFGPSSLADYLYSIYATYTDY